MHQRDVFCVFSGEGVTGLRYHLNVEPGYALYRDIPLGVPGFTATAQNRPFIALETPRMNATNGHMLNFDDADVDAATDDGLDEGNDMALDTSTHPAVMPTHVAGPAASNNSLLPSAPNPNTLSLTVPTALPFMPIGGHGTRPPDDGIHPAQRVHYADPQAFAYLSPPLPLSSASVAPVRSFSATQQQASALAYPSTGPSHRMPAPMAIIQPVPSAGASTATLIGPSHAQSGGPDASHMAENYGAEAGGAAN